jgi:hypothetical protein
VAGLPAKPGIHLYRTVNGNSATRLPRLSLLSFRWVNSVPQACIKSSQFAFAPGISCKFLSGGKMDNVTKISNDAVPAAADNFIIN